MGDYYWMGDLEITPGQIVTPNDIGFRSRVQTTSVVVKSDGIGYSSTDYSPIALLEMILEYTRLRDFPNKPSRFESLFIWDNETWAQEYHNNVTYAGLYLVKISVNEQIFSGDYSLVTYFRPLPDTVEQMADRARRYWGGEITDKYEVVLNGAIEVISRIDRH